MESEWIFMFRQIRQPHVPVLSMFDRTASEAVAPEKCEDRKTIEIYRAVIRRLFGSAEFSVEGPARPLLFILYADSGDPEILHTGTPVFSETVRRGIIRGSGDLPVRIVWVEDTYGVGGDAENGYVPSKGAAVKFSAIRCEKADMAFVNGTIHSWDRPPRGFEYVVEKNNGSWMVRSSYHQWID